MTPAVLRAAALAHDGYETPALNDRLYLHYRVRLGLFGVGRCDGGYVGGVGLQNPKKQNPNDGTPTPKNKTTRASGA